MKLNAALFIVYALIVAVSAFLVYSTISLGPRFHCEPDQLMDEHGICRVVYDKEAL